MKHNRILASVAMAAIVLVSLCAVGASTLSVSAAQGSSSNPTLVGAAVGAGAPGVCSQNGVGLDLFIRAANNTLYWKDSPDGTTWSSTNESLGGVLTSAPAANVTESTMWVFVRGGDGAVWAKNTTNGGTSWSNWISLSGQLATNTGPAVCSWDAGRLDVFVQGTNGALYWKYSTNNGASWSYWNSLGGKLTSAPAATAMGSPNQIGVFVAGGSSALYYKHYDDSSSSWASWTSLGGQVLAGTSPTAYNWGTTQIGWFVTGANNQLYLNYQTFTPGGTTSGWQNLGGYLTSSPGATAKAPGLIDVFGRGGSGDFAVLWQKSYNGTKYPLTNGWSDWTYIGGL
jgi:hypothetical protein